MTAGLWQVLILIAIAVGLAAHNHRLQDNEPIISDFMSRTGETSDSRLKG